MTPILDPRNGDIEDDAASTKRRSMLSLAGSLLAEISLPKLVIAWMLLIGFPGLLLGAAPLLVSIWIASVWAKAANIFAEILPALLLPPLVAIGWFAGRPLLRLAESSFWSLNALAVQPVYIVFREGLRHLAEQLLAPRMSEARRASVRAGAAAVSGFAICGLGVGVVVLVWPASRWVGSLADLDAAAPVGARRIGEQCRAHLRLFCGGRADLGNRRCDDGAATRPARLRRARATGGRNMARRASVGHPHGRRALRVSHRERQVRAARQRATEADAGAAGRDPCGAAAGRDPDNGRPDRRRPLRGMGRVIRCVGRLPAIGRACGRAAGQPRRQRGGSSEPCPDGPADESYEAAASGPDDLRTRHAAGHAAPCRGQQGWSDSAAPSPTR